jgi:hypothetical protein
MYRDYMLVAKVMDYRKVLYVFRCKISMLIHKMDLFFEVSERVISKWSSSQCTLPCVVEM